MRHFCLGRGGRISFCMMPTLTNENGGWCCADGGASVGAITVLFRFVAGVNSCVVK